MSAPLLIALTDMTANLSMAGCVLALGIVLLRLLSPQEAKSKSQIWIPVAPLIAGPLASLFFWVLDFLVIQPINYLFPSDYLDALLPALLIGIFVGIVASLVFVVAFRIGNRKNE